MIKGQLLGIPNWLKKKIDALETKINTDLAELFQSVSSGKAKVASAITGKGVTTASDATFDVMAENVGKIVTGKVISLGTGTSFNVKTVCANNGIDYTKLTNNNFIVGIRKANAFNNKDSNMYQDVEGHYNYAQGDGVTASHSYNASTGVLTCSGSAQTIRWRDYNYSQATRNSWTQSMTMFAYLVYTG